MGEILYLHERDRLLVECDRIGYAALREVTGRYGFGDVTVDTEYPPEIFPLAYHNAQHTLRVRDAASIIADEHGLPPYDKAIAIMAASAHDIYHDKSSEPSDEERSADWLTNEMRSVGFPDEDNTIARLAILGTTPVYGVSGEMIGQQFSQTPFPSARAGEIALCVAIADLSAIFSPVGPQSAHELLLERLGCPSTIFPPTLEGVLEFQQKQITFLETHQPLYPALEQFWGDLRHEAIAHHTSIINDIQSGTITNWAEIFQRDSLFLRTHSRD